MRVDLRREGHGDEKRSPAHRLVGRYDGRHRPLRHDESELLLEATQTLKSIFDRVDPLLKDDLLGGTLELLAREPAAVRQRPVAAAAVNPAMSEEEREKLLALSPKVVRRCLARPHKIAHSFMSPIRRPDPGQFARPMQSSKRDRIAPVGLDPLARPFRDQGRRDHQAVVSQRPHLAIKPVSRRPGLKADMQLIVAARQSLDRLLDRQGAVLDIAEKPHFSLPPSFRYRHGVLLLGDIEATKTSLCFSMVRPPCMRLGSVRPSNPRSHLHERAAPPAQPANMTSRRPLMNFGFVRRMMPGAGVTVLSEVACASFSARAL
jgi:hypothetical protein